MTEFLQSLPRALAALLLLIAPGLAAAEGADAREQAATAARAALERGSKDVVLRDQGVLSLPDGYGFIPQAQAAALMRTMGNRTGPNFLGIVVPLERAERWFVTVSYDPAGYVKDDDAKHWDADKLLQSLKEGTEAANQEREKAGVAPIVVTRWIEPPAYDPLTHRLVWSAEARLKSGTDPDPVINYNTYLLGREGYLSLNLITSTSAIDTDKAAARELLSDVKFDSGKTYADFKPATDKIAAYGLAALVAGVAAKKLGLLAILAATLVKFAKVIAIGAAGGFAALSRWWKSRTGRTA